MFVTEQIYFLCSEDNQKPFVLNDRKALNSRTAFHRIGLEQGDSSQKKQQTFVKWGQNLPLGFHLRAVF